jgi:hypothetical protein
MENNEGSLYIIGCDPFDYEKDINKGEYRKLLEEWQARAADTYSKLNSGRTEGDYLVSH